MWLRLIEKLAENVSTIVMLRGSYCIIVVQSYSLSNHTTPKMYAVSGAEIATRL